MQGYFARETYFGCRKALFLMQKRAIPVGLYFERVLFFKRDQVL